MADPSQGPEQRAEPRLEIALNSVEETKTTILKALGNATHCIPVPQADIAETLRRKRRPDILLAAAAVHGVLTLQGTVDSAHDLGEYLHLVRIEQAREGLRGERVSKARRAEVQGRLDREQREHETKARGFEPLVQAVQNFAVEFNAEYTRPDGGRDMKALRSLYGQTDQSDSPILKALPSPAAPEYIQSHGRDSLTSATHLVHYMLSRAQQLPSAGQSAA